MSTDSSERNPVEKLAEEFVDRRRRGDSVTIEDYAERFPQWAAQILDVFPTLVVIERLGAETLECEPLSPPAEPPRLERIGDYRILREVGRGGMGVVYEAEQESLGRRVALKVMLPSALVDARHLARFEREARAAAGLHHTNIVPVFGVGRQDEMHYFVMQLIDGCGLDKVLVELRQLRRQRGRAHDNSSSSLTDVSTPGDPADRGVQKPAQTDGREPGRASSVNSLSSATDSAADYYRGVARLVVQVADALDYANAQGILHRDVKPANLLLDDAGTLWVTDFGLAKATDSDDLTNTGDIVGTLRYMAPERFENECTARSDIYGLGLTLYELVTLQPAYDESDRATLIARLIHDDPPSPRKLAADIPRDLETILLKSVARNPAARYATAGQFADDLRRFLDDRPIHARRIGPLERTWRWCRRNPAMAAMTTSILLLLVAVSVAYLKSRSALAEARQARAGESQALHQAEQRAADAEAAQQLAADAVDEYFTNVSESKLIDVPGLQPLRRELLISALAYYEQLSEIGGSRPGLQRELVLAHERVARINELIGSTEVAIDRYLLTLKLLDESHRSTPNAPEYLRQSARCHRRLGVVLRNEGYLERAEEHLHASVVAYDLVAAVDAGDEALRIEQALAYAQRGTLHARRRQPQAGVRDCQHAIEILRSLKQETTSRNAAFAAAFNMLGTVHADEQTGDFQDAIAPFTESVRYYRRVLKDEPRQNYRRSELARALTNLGRARFAAQDVAGAIALFDEALEIRRQLHDQNHDVGVYQSDVISSHVQLAKTYGRIEEPAKSIDALQAAIELQNDLVERHPDVDSYRRALANLWYELGFQQERANLAAEAEVSCATAVRLAEALLASVDAKADHYRFIGEICNNVGGILRNQGDDEAARQQFRRAVDAARALAREYGETNDSLVLIAWYETNLGNLESSVENIDSAVGAFDAAIVALQKILAQQPEHSAARIALYNALRSRGIVLSKVERHLEAVTNLERARALAPAEHTTYATQLHGFAMARAGIHRGAAKAAEQLLGGDSLRFYYKLPNGPALLRHLAATILAAASETAREDGTLGAAERTRVVDQYATRAVELLVEAADADLYASASHHAELVSHAYFDPLRDRSDFQRLLERLVVQPER